MAAPRLELQLSESSINISNNTSVVTASLYLYGNGESWSGYQESGTIVIDGASYSFTSSFSKSGTQLLASRSRTITHNSDGSRSVSVRASFATGGFYGTVSTSKSMTLTTIPRATQPSTSGTNLGQAITIRTPRYSSGFTHTLRYEWQDKRGTIATGVGDSYTWTVPLNFANDIPNATSGRLNVLCDTYNGSTLLGTKYDYATMSVPQSVVPSIGSVSHSEAVEEVSRAFGRYCRGLSKINVSLAASGAYGSKITSYRTSLDGVVYNDSKFQTNIIEGSGQLTMTVTVEDSRKRTAQKAVQIYVHPYSFPTITSTSISQSGSTTYVRVKGSVDSVGGNNTKTLKVYYRAAGAESWSVKTMTPSDWDFDQLVSISGLDSTITYEITPQIDDKLKSTSRWLATGTPVISRLAGGKGVRLFGEAEKEGFWVGNVDYTITDDEFNVLKKLVGGAVRLYDLLKKIVERKPKWRVYDPVTSFLSKQGATWTAQEDGIRHFVVGAESSSTPGVYYITCSDMGKDSPSVLCLIAVNGGKASGSIPVKTGYTYKVDYMRNIGSVTSWLIRLDQ